MSGDFSKVFGGHDKVVVINFGGQYMHLIARRIRELNVYSEIVHAHQTSPSHLRELKPKAVILSGGPSSVSDEMAERFRWVLDLGVPVLGICYGHQLIAKMLGGRVLSGRGEFGRTLVRVVERDVLFDGWSDLEYVWMSHNDYIDILPKSAKVLAYSENNVVAAFKVVDRPIYGVQFHPEVKHTEKGLKLLENFVIRIAGARRTWFVESLIDQIVSDIKSKVGRDERVLVALSGGVDSTVTAVLVKRAVGDRLVPVFVNHGLLRDDEAEEVLSNLRRIGIEPIYIDASRRFLESLKDVEDCESKRRVIGEEFARIFREVVERDPSIRWLAQGTLYPDVIESGAEPGSDRIKSHHNVAGLPAWLNLRLIEPLRHFYKDEVRRMAIALGIPEEIAYRHPFPGPGLAVRIIGKVTERKLAIVRRATKIVEEEIRRAGLYGDVWQAFAVVGDDKWVGVKGDARVEGYIVIVRIVCSEDGMTADWPEIPYEVLRRISSRITNEIPDVTMVAYAIATKPPSTIEPC